MVVDASVVVDQLLGASPATGLPAGPVCAPEILVAEVLSALRRAERRGVLSPHRARAAIMDLVALDLDLIGHAALARRAFDLRANVTSADALYVALAEALDAPLLTADAGLARATLRHTGVSVLVAD